MQRLKINKHQLNILEALNIANKKSQYLEINKIEYYQGKRVVICMKTKMSVLFSLNFINRLKIFSNNTERKIKNTSTVIGFIYLEHI